MNRRFKSCLTALFTLMLAPAAGAHRDDATPGKAAGYGQVLFKTSCTTEGQKQFDRALAMLHSFYFPETVKAFNTIPEADPSCAIAYWGIAISQRKVFHALALNEVFDHKSMAPLQQAIALLTPLDKKYPDHPGITHYLIHSYDFAPVA